MLKKIAISMAVAAALSGCAGNQSGLTISDLQDPKTTPQAKWSDAMHVVQAMHLPNIYDIPKDLSQRLAGGTPVTTGTTQSVTTGSVVTASTGVASGAPMSGVGVGVAAVSLLTSGLGNLEKHVQVAAWVPMTQASSLDEAAKVAEAAWAKARKETFPIVVSTSAYADFAQAGAFIPDNKKDWVREQRTNVMPPHLSPQVPSYGPVYIRVMDEITNNVYKNKLSAPQAFTTLSGNLPEWFYIYSPGAPYGKNMRAPSVFNHAKEYTFVGK